MPEVLNQLQTFTIPHPGKYDIQVLSGGPVAYFKDEELPQAVSNKPVETEGRLHLIATGNALVSISDHVEAKRSHSKKPASK